MYYVVNAVTIVRQRESEPQGSHQILTLETNKIIHLLYPNLPALLRRPEVHYRQKQILGSNVLVHRRGLAPPLIGTLVFTLVSPIALLGFLLS